MHEGRAGGEGQLGCWGGTLSLVAHQLHGITLVPQTRTCSPSAFCTAGALVALRWVDWLRCAGLTGCAALG